MHIQLYWMCSICIYMHSVKLHKHSFKLCLHVFSKTAYVCILKSLYTYASIKLNLLAYSKDVNACIYKLYLHLYWMHVNATVLMHMYTNISECMWMQLELMHRQLYWMHFSIFMLLEIKCNTTLFQLVAFSFILSTKITQTENNVL